jgi:hypothetical protein
MLGHRGQEARPVQERAQQCGGDEARAVAAMNNTPAVVARTSRDLMARLLTAEPRRARPARVRRPGRQRLLGRG